MTPASHISLSLARFDTLRQATAIELAPCKDALFHALGADTRAAATEPASQEAFTLVLIGLHEDEGSANRAMDDRRRLAPGFAEAAEVWSAVLHPFRHTGAANYLDRTSPGEVFGSLGPQPAADEPIAILTSSGWSTGEGFDMNRVREFSTGVMAVRMAMSGIAGLISQQSFFFPRVLEYDPMTVTLWRSTAAARAFAYGPGVHQAQMQRQKAQVLADRTSFTRCRISRSEGSWHGVSFA
jgi:hypothetical protein